MTIQVSAELQTEPMGRTASPPPLYLSQLLLNRPPLAISTLGDKAATQLQAFRDQASALTQELTLPTPRNEEWRFTDLSPLRRISFTSRSPELTCPASMAALLRSELPLRLTFVNGVYAPEWSALSTLPPGLRVSTLGDQENLLPLLGQQPGAEEAFTLLNSASFSDVAVIQVAPELHITTPVHLLFVSLPGAMPALHSPRCLIKVGRNSNLTLIEEYVAIAEGTDLTNAVTEIWLQENAQLNHSRIQRQANTDFHIGKTAVSQQRDSRYACHAISLGGQISRHHLEVHSLGSQTETRLQGLTVATGDQLADTHSTISFSQPSCRSQQLHKCIVSDQARGVFNGKVFVPRAAQLTDAAQLNRNLLLSPKARIDTKPQLEIVADNVKCSHGATVSQLSADEVFYLQSRGLDYQSACNLLVEGFAVELLESIPSVSLRKRLTQLILTKIRSQPT